MSHGLVKYLYYLDGYGYFFRPEQANRVDAEMVLVRGTYHTLRIQGVKTTAFDLTSDLKAPAAALPDWPTFSSAVFGLKTPEEYEADGDFAAAWTGFDTGDTAWHSPSNCRYSIAVAPTSSLDAGTYMAAAQLSTGSITMPLPDFAMRVPLLRQLVIGDEPTVPGSVANRSGTATLADGTDSIAVSFTGMTSGGLVIPFWIGAAQGTLGVVAAANAFTITSSGPVSGASQVGYYVARVES